MSLSNGLWAKLQSIVELEAVSPILSPCLKKYLTRSPYKPNPQSKKGKILSNLKISHCLSRKILIKTELR